MTKKKANKKNKKTADIKRILLLIFGSAAVISMFFIAGFLIDYAALKFSRTSPPDRFSIIKKGENTGAPSKKAAKQSVLKKDNFSFFETLSKKDGKKAEHDIKRENVLRTHTVKKPEIKSETQSETKPDKPVRSSTAYAAQLGSFKGFGAARTFRDGFIKKGYKAYIVSASLPGKGTLYRVRIGRFRDIEDAQKFSSDFEKKEKVSVFITSK